MEQAKDDLGTADDPLTLARAREQLRSAQWELERLFSRLYGQKQEITHNVADDLADRLMRARDRLNQPNAAVLPPVSTQTALIEDAQVIDPT
jgi:cob(I)alamin adenosyltransferase